MSNHTVVAVYETAAQAAAAVNDLSRWPHTGLATTRRCTASPSSMPANALNSELR